MPARLLIIVMLVVPVPGVVLMQLLGAFRAFEVVAFAGKAGKCDGQDEQRGKFHRRAS